MRSPEELRRNLAEAILHVRSGRATSRRTLADVMHLSPTTAGLYADQLIEADLLHESGLEQGAMGRPKRMLETAAGAGWFAGVEFNAERVRIVGVDFSGKHAGGDMRPLPGEADAGLVMSEVNQVIRAMRSSRRGPLLGIGFGAPGIVDPAQGIGVEYAFMDSWRNVPVAALLKKPFKVPVTLENNLRAIALAERWFGGARKLSDFIIVGPRSGFGIAIVHGGRVMSGVHHAAGEIGYWFSPDRAAGTRLHDRLSSPAVWRRLTGSSTRTKPPGDLHAALSKLASTTGEAWNEIIQDYAQLLSSLQLLLDTSACFLHGPLTALEPRFCAEVVAEASKLAPSLSRSPLMFVPSKLDDEAGALGAASLAMEAWVPAV